MANSSTVTSGQQAGADQYNKLRLDVLDVTTGHKHTTVDSAQVDHVNLGNKGVKTHAQIDAHIATGPHPAEQHLLVGSYVVSTTNAPYAAYHPPGYSIYLNPSDWDGTDVWYFEAVLKSDADGAGYAAAALFAGGTSLVEVQHTNTTPTRVRSGAVAMPAGAQEFQVKIYGDGARECTIYRASLIVDLGTVGN